MASVEVTIHEGLKDLAQQVLEQHGVRLEHVRFHWLEQIGGNATLYRVNVETQTGPRFRTP